LSTVVEHLGRNDDLAALGLFVTLDADIVELRTLLMRIAKLTGSRLNA
jgi:hypothetical protein